MSFLRLTIVLGQCPQYPSKMSLEIVGRTGTIMVKLWLCKNQDCPVSKMKKPSAKEGGCIWLFEANSSTSSSQFLLLADSDSHTPLCTCYVTLNHSLPFQKCKKLCFLKKAVHILGQGKHDFNGVLLCLLEGGKLAKENVPFINL